MEDISNVEIRKIMKRQFKSQPRKSQHGLSFLGLIFVGGTLAVAGVITAQIVPTYIEYQAIVKAAGKAAQGNSVVEVRTLFDRQAAVDDFKAVSGKDLDVTKEGDKIVVKFAYQREIHLTGPAFLTLKYAGQSK